MHDSGISWMRVRGIFFVLGLTLIGSILFFQVQAKAGSDANKNLSINQIQSAHRKVLFQSIKIHWPL
jgi:uncharacterized membrane protein YczE